MHEEMNRFCVEIGRNPLLVQGAGGNVSWKDDDILWVKASGTSLAEADKKNIFVPVELDYLKQEIAVGNFAAVPKVIGEASMRPSIETMLHALMPQKIVVHLHAIDALSYLVRENGVEEIAQKLGDKIKWTSVGYFKPGAELAAEIYKQLKKSPDANIVFLENHGVVIGGDDIGEIKSALAAMEEKLAIKTARNEVHELAQDTKLFNMVKNFWAILPDHVVFLGSKANCYDKLEEVREKDELAFVSGQSVVMKDSLSKVKREQLKCYYDILVRQPDGAKLKTLSEEDIARLLNWDAEHYRQNLNKI